MRHQPPHMLHPTIPSVEAYMTLSTLFPFLALAINKRDSCPMKPISQTLLPRLRLQFPQSSAAILGLSFEPHVRHRCMITRAGVETRDFVVEEHIQMCSERRNVLDSFNLLLRRIRPHARCREIKIDVFKPLCISLQSLHSTPLLLRTSMCRMR
jgi:hypothetical protein